MENKQLHENSQQQWISTWSSFIAQTPFHDGEKHENATNIIVRVLETLQQGNSCIEATEDQVKVLNNLVGFEQQEHLPVAPFIFDGSSLYLYRYWNLETRLAKQIERLWQQQIPPVDLTAYSGLLQDKYQKSALTMVAGKILSMITGGPGTGKTYTLARIIAVLNRLFPISVLLWQRLRKGCPAYAGSTTPFFSRSQTAGIWFGHTEPANADYSNHSPAAWARSKPATAFS